MSDKILYEDVVEYEHLFTMAPSFLLRSMIRRNSNLVSKFRPAIESHLSKLDDEHKAKLDVILNSDIDDLQSVLAEAYKKRRINQYKILADPKNRDFVEMNLKELKKIV